MHVIKITTLSVHLDATEQFVTTQNYSDKQIHITDMEAKFQEGQLVRINAEGFKVLGTTGKPGKQRVKTTWFSTGRGGDLIAPGAVIKVVDRAKQGRSL